jgi:hypothetical protein
MDVYNLVDTLKRCEPRAQGKHGETLHFLVDTAISIFCANQATDVGTTYHKVVPREGIMIRSGRKVHVSSCTNVMYTCKF